MKLKKGLILAVIISIILISIPTEVLAWVTMDTTYEVCNIINVCISGTMRLLALSIAIIYVISVNKYIKSSQEEKKQKIKNIQTSLIITIIQIIVLLFGASWVIKIGMETYTIGEKGQVFDIDTLIPNAMRIIAFVLFIFYIIKSVIYFISEEEEVKKKIKKLIIWEIVVAAIVAALLILAKIV